MKYTASFRLAQLLLISGFLLAPAFADTVLPNVAVGSSPNAAAVNPVTNQIYVINNKGKTVSVIDGATNASVATVNVGTNPIAVGVNAIANHIYVANAGSNNVTVINGETNAVAATVKVGATPTAVAVDSVHNLIYVANYGSANVSVIDGATNSVTATQAADANPDALALDPVTGTVVAANYGSANATVLQNADYPVGETGMTAVAFNPVTNQIYLASAANNNVVIISLSGGPNVTIPVGTTPAGIAVNPITNQIYVANSGSGNVTVIDGATQATTTIGAGTNPGAVSVNSATNKIYVANNGSGNVTVIDGTTNTAATVSAGTNPVAVAVNPVTNLIYVPNQGSGNVTVIDGEELAVSGAPSGLFAVAFAVNPVTNQIFIANNQASGTVTVVDGNASLYVTQVNVGPNPVAVAVNPVTNQIYVANSGNATVTAIDGTTYAATSVAVGNDPTALAVNPVTDRIYVANAADGAVTVIDGATNAPAATVTVGTTPTALALNPATNQIYVANNGSANVTVIDGATNNTTSVTAGTKPQAVAVNSVTNQIYVVNNGSANLTVIDGVTNIPSNVGVGTTPVSVAVNPVTNQIYVANSGSANVTVIDGATNAVTNVSVPGHPSGVTVDPATNRIYISNSSGGPTILDGNSNTTTAVNAGVMPGAMAVNPVTNTIYGLVPSINFLRSISPAAPTAAELLTLINPLAGNVTFSATPVIAFQAASGYAPMPIPPREIFYQVDAITGPWQGLTATNGNASATLASLAHGLHTIYAFATDGQESTSIDAASSPIPGRVTAYAFVYGDTAPTAAAQTVTVERGAKTSITLNGSGSSALTYDIITQPAHGTLSGTAPNLTFTASATDTGSDSFTFLVSDGASASAIAVVGIAIVDSPPAAVNDSYYLASASRSPLTLSVLANDSDPEGRPLTIIAVSNADEGRVSIALGGQSLIYQPEVDFAVNARADKFTYTISNGDQTATAQVDVYNPYYHHQKSFDGLITDATNGAGYLALTVNGAGAFTGSLKLDGLVTPFHGFFAANGSFTLVISRKSPLLPLTLNLQFDQVAGATIAASVTDGLATYTGTLEPQVTAGTTDPVGETGSCTVMILPPTPLPGTAAAATVMLANGEVSGFTLTSGGSGYVTPPLVAISGAGSGATALATIAGGAVTGLTLTKPGSKYGTSGATVTINPPADSLPGGTGWGLATVSAPGVVTTAGELADGTPFSCSGLIKSNSTFPIYVPLNATGSLGSLSGVATFMQTANVSDFSATLTWSKAAQTKPELYQAGFITQVMLLGSYYAPVKGAPALAFTSAASPTATLNLTGGSLVAAVQDSISVSSANGVKELGSVTDHLHLVISGANGLLTGSFLSSAKSTSAIKGVIFQKQNLAAGLFASPTLTGNFTLDPH